MSDPIRELKDLIENGSGENCPDCDGTGMSLAGLVIMHVPICLTCGGSGKKK